MPPPSGELSNMRYDLAYAPDSVRMGVIQNIVADLQGSTDAASRSVGDRARALLDDNKQFDASQLVVRYLRGDTGGRRR